MIWSYVWSFSMCKKKKKKKKNQQKSHNAKIVEIIIVKPGFIYSFITFLGNSGKMSFQSTSKRQ